MMEQATATLTPAEKDQLNDARVKAMAQNPELQTEEMDLMQKMMTLQQGDATDADKQALREAMRAHGDKVRAAMRSAVETACPRSRSRVATASTRPCAAASGPCSQSRW